MQNNWLNRGEGGEWYEPHVMNGDVLQILWLTVAACSLILTLIALI